MHNGGINANSTPQEIAAASVGTKLDNSGKPIISSSSQGESYSKALRNIKSNTQQGVSYVGNDTTGGKAPTSTNQTASSDKTSQPVNYKVTNAVSFLAAENLGMSTDSRGTPYISNRSDGEKFMLSTVT